MDQDEIDRMVGDIIADPERKFLVDMAGFVSFADSQLRSQYDLLQRAEYGAFYFPKVRRFADQAVRLGGMQELMMHMIGQYGQPDMSNEDILSLAKCLVSRVDNVIEIAIPIGEGR